MEVAKALVGSFKLVTLVPRTVREMTQLLRGVFLGGRQGGRRGGKEGRGGDPVCIFKFSLE